MIIYRIELNTDDNGTLMVTCPVLPEVTTFGETSEDAIKNAVDAIEEALAGRMADGDEIPDGYNPEVELAEGALVRVPILSSVKVLLYVACRSAGVTRAELSRRLGWHREQVDRLFRLDHASRLDQLDAAFKALGRDLDFAISEAA